MRDTRDFQARPNEQFEHLKDLEAGSNLEVGALLNDFKTLNLSRQTSDKTLRGLGLQPSDQLLAQIQTRSPGGTMQPDTGGSDKYIKDKDGNWVKIGSGYS